MTERASMKEFTQYQYKCSNISTNSFRLFIMLEGSRGHILTYFLTKTDTGNTPKEWFLSRKRVKVWREVTFMKKVKALDDTRILALNHLKFVVSFPRYGHLKKKCWYKKFCNSKSWLLLTGHFHTAFSMEHNSCDPTLLSSPVQTTGPCYEKADA